MKSIYGVLILLISINLLKAQRQCQEPPVAASFLDVNSLIGKWFIVKSVGENYGECATLNFELKNWTTSEVSSVITELKPSALEYVIRNQSNFILSIDETALNTLNIIESDYVNYALVHFCNGDVNNFDEKIWILSKNRTLSVALNKSIMKRSNMAFPNINFTTNYQTESM